MTEPSFRREDERLLTGKGCYTADCLVGVTYPNGCHIAEVEIDPDTGEVEVLAYTTVDDIGAAIDRASVEGRVHGGVMQGVGQVLGEAATDSKMATTKKPHLRSDMNAR